MVTTRLRGPAPSVRRLDGACRRAYGQIWQLRCFAKSGYSVVKKLLPAEESTE